MSNQPFVPDPRYPQGQQPIEPSPYGEHTFVRGQSGPAEDVQINQESYASPTGSQIERREEVYDDPELRKANWRYWITTVVYFLLGVLEIILALRFVFRALGANTDNAFIRALYDVSHVFIAPFTGIFGNPGAGQAHVLEVSTLVAMLIYALIAWGIVRLSQIVLSPTPESRRQYTMERQRRTP